MRPNFDFQSNATFHIHKNEIVRLIDQIHAMDNTIEISWIPVVESLKHQDIEEAKGNLERLLAIANDLSSTTFDRENWPLGDQLYQRVLRCYRLFQEIAKPA